MFKADSYPICIAELRSAGRELDNVMDEDEKARLIDWLAINPEAGDVIPGANGVRKMRWGYRGSGKRGGLRIIYYFRDLNMPIYLLAVYRKGEKISLTAKEKREVSMLVDELVEEYASRNFNLSRVLRDPA